MADFSIKLIADKLGKSLEDLSTKVEDQLNQAVADLATAAHASMVARVQSMNMDPKNRQDYLRGLNVTQLAEDSWLIHLDGTWAQKLEEGFSGYDMKKELLSSQKKVKVGSRAGEDWVRKSSLGVKYAAVPMQKKPSAGGGSGDIAQEMKKLTAFNRMGVQQPLLKTFNDELGNPIQGKVAKSKSKMQNLNGVTKYQHVSKSGKVSSIYMTYRMVSENSSGFIHPGFKGYGLFKEAEDYIEQELNNIVKTLL